MGYAILSELKKKRVVPRGINFSTDIGEPPFVDATGNLLPYSYRGGNNKKENAIVRRRTVVRMRD